MEVGEGAFANCKALSGVDLGKRLNFASIRDARLRVLSKRCMYCGGTRSLLGRCQSCREKNEDIDQYELEHFRPK